MKCPHCLESFHENLQYTALDAGYGREWVADADGFWSAIHENCPACGRKIIFLILTARGNPREEVKRILVWPKAISRAPLAAEVPEAFSADYREACLVLADSAKASAALSRRSLQHLLRETAGTKKKDLADQIDEVLASKTLPSDLAEAIDAIRAVGNFAAHPLKSTNTGAILDVEPGEAEWLLDVLEALFDFYFVRPARLAAKRAALDQKLTDAGKPPMKSPAP